MNSQPLTQSFKAIAFSMIAICALSTGMKTYAQTKEVTKEVSKEKKVIEEKNIIIKDGDKKIEKMTVIVDGDKVTINGKPVENWKEEDLAKLHNKKIIMNMHGMNGMNMKMPPFEIETDIVSNKALLGVITEKIEKGAMIKEVNKETAAAKAGLLANDVITKINDTKISPSTDLYNVISKFKPEEKVTIHFLRDGKEKTTTAILGKNKEVNIRSMKFDKGDFDIRIPNMEHSFNFNDNKEIHINPSKPKLGLQIEDLEEGNGVKIIDIDTALPAGKAGLKENDIITEINGKELKSVDDLKAKMKETKEGESIKLTYKRNGNLQTTEIKIPKKLKKANL